MIFINRLGLPGKKIFEHYQIKHAVETGWMESGFKPYSFSKAAGSCLDPLMFPFTSAIF